jgi:hypothetical protein
MTWPTSIRDINDLPEGEKLAIYKTLLPDWLFTKYGIDRQTLEFEGLKVAIFRCPVGSRALEISVKRRASDVDPVLYLNLADTFNNQLIVLLMVVNDPESERYDIDVDQDGNHTHLGTTGRNINAEVDAMRAGLAPGQVRRGMRTFKQSLPLFEVFVQKMGHDLFLIEPLAYHNAIIFERYGFNYMLGHKDMLRINADFQPGGDLHRRLSPNEVFRQPESWRSIRGRSWSIHDGILGHPFTGFQMYKRIGIDAGINTFPDAEW